MRACRMVLDMSKLNYVANKEDYFYKKMAKARTWKDYEKYMNLAVWWGAQKLKAHSLDMILLGHYQKINNKFSR